MGGTLTSVFTHDGRFYVVRRAAPRAEGLGVASVHCARLLVEAVVPARVRRKEEVISRKTALGELRKRVHVSAREKQDG